MSNYFYCRISLKDCYVERDYKVVKIKEFVI